MFKIITKSLLKKKISVLFIIIQISIINVVLYETITEFNIINNQKLEVESILQKNTENMINIKFNDLYPDDNFASKTKELDNRLNSQNQIEYAGGFTQTSIKIKQLENNSEFLEMQKEIYKGTKQENYIKTTKAMFLDKGMNRFLNLKIVEGRNFSEDDFNLKDGQTVPILLGNKFRGILNIGDKLNAYNLIGSDKEKTFIIIGFLKDNMYSLNDSHFIENEKVNLNNFIIIPSYESNNSVPSIVSKACSYFVYAKDKSYIENIKLNINMEASRLGLNVECSTFNEIYQNYIEDNSQMNQIIIITIIFLVLITIFSITSTIVISIKKRKRELGIRIVTGASKFYIKRMYLYEIAIIASIADLISLIYIIRNRYEYTVYFLKKTFNIWNDINIKELSYILIFTFIIALISSLIPLRKIGLLQPKEIIGGNE